MENHLKTVSKELERLCIAANIPSEIRMAAAAHIIYLFPNLPMSIGGSLVLMANGLLQRDINDIDIIVEDLKKLKDSWEDTEFTFWNEDVEVFCKASINQNSAYKNNISFKIDVYTSYSKDFSPSRKYIAINFLEGRVVGPIVPIAEIFAWKLLYDRSKDREDVISMLRALITKAKPLMNNNKFDSMLNGLELRLTKLSNDIANYIKTSKQVKTIAKELDHCWFELSTGLPF